MGTRPDFQSLLEGLQDGSFVYFQPPTNVEVQYPAIIYNQDYQKTQYADNLPYRRTTRYMVTVVDRDPDSTLKAKVAALPMTTYVRHYTTESLNHDVFDVYF
jgi:hypothetical protein